MAEALFVELHEVYAVQDDATGICMYVARQQPEDCPGQGCLATSGLAQNGQRPPAVQIKADMVYRPHYTIRSAEVKADIIDLEQRARACRQAGGIASNRLSCCLHSSHYTVLSLGLNTRSSE